MKSPKWMTIGAAFFCLVLISGCAGKSMVRTSQWTAPHDVAMDEVFKAALKAGAENGLAMVHADRVAGVITLKNESKGGAKEADRWMDVRLKTADGKIMVSTRVQGEEPGLLQSRRGGPAEELITNFYASLFKELNIMDPSYRKVIIANENEVVIPLPAVQAEKAEAIPIAQPASSGPEGSTVQEEVLVPIRPSSRVKKPTYLLLTRNANIRSEPNTKSKIISTLQKGKKLEKLGLSGDWYGVRLPSGDAGWVNRRLAVEAE